MSVTAMVSTVICCFDGYTRVSAKITQLVTKAADKESAQYIYKKAYLVWLVIIAIGSLSIINFFMLNMKQMITLATTLSFVAAPVIAFLNYRLISSKEFTQQHSLSWSQKSVFIICLITLSVFTLWYISFNYL